MEDVRCLDCVRAKDNSGKWVLRYTVNGEQKELLLNKPIAPCRLQQVYDSERRMIEYMKNQRTYLLTNIMKKEISGLIFTFVDYIIYNKDGSTKDLSKSVMGEISLNTGIFYGSHEFDEGMRNESYLANNSGTLVVNKGNVIEEKKHLVKGGWVQSFADRLKRIIINSEFEESMSDRSISEVRIYDRGDYMDIQGAMWGGAASQWIKTQKHTVSVADMLAAKDETKKLDQMGRSIATLQKSLYMIIKFCNTNGYEPKCVRILYHTSVVRMIVEL